MPPMFVECPHCGAEFEDRHNFCPKCGQPRSRLETELRVKAQESGTPYETVLEQAREEDAQAATQAIRKKNIRWLAGSGVLIVGCIAFFVVGALISNNTETEANDANDVPTRRTATSAAVAYTIETEQVGQRVRVSYNNASGGFEHTHTGATDTWTETFRMSAGEHAYVTASIPFDGRGVVRCTLRIDGAIVETQTAEGASGSVTCSGIVRP